MSRIVIWFSCGAASAVATKLALDQYKNRQIIINYCDTGSEHPDNYRFLSDCEKLFGHKINILKSKKYKDTWDVFTKTNYLVGPKGARCTIELKKRLRFDFQKSGDLQVFGFTIEETSRANRFIDQNHDIAVLFPLIEKKYTKKDCFLFLENKGIALPVMYKLGYKNNNCIGCVKGQAGYWNKVRKDFPDVFEKMAKLERQLDVAICKTYKNGKRTRIFLDELDEKAGKYQIENISCGLLCDPEK